MNVHVKLDTLFNNTTKFFIFYRSETEGFHCVEDNKVTKALFIETKVSYPGSNKLFENEY